MISWLLACPWWYTTSVIIYALIVTAGLTRYIVVMIKVDINVFDKLICIFSGVCRFSFEFFVYIAIYIICPKWVLLVFIVWQTLSLRLLQIQKKIVNLKKEPLYE